MFRTALPGIAGCLCCLSCAAAVATEPSLLAVKTDRPPRLDGRVEHGEWDEAPFVRFDAVGRGGPTKGQDVAVTVKAAYDDENIYFLLRWQDATQDATHKSYVWNESKHAYESGPDREDNAALSFPIRGNFTANMLSGEDELWDVWHWKAHRTGPAGYAMDRTHVFSKAKPEGKAKEFEARNGNRIWIARPEDTGVSVTEEHPVPQTKQSAAPRHFEAVRPSGSAADIRTGHNYADGWWTVEFARKLQTGQDDDVQFDTSRPIPMGVAVFDKSEHEYHYTAGPMTLMFTGGPVASFPFDQDPAGEVPGGWKVAQTNPTRALASWEVAADPTAPSKPNVLALTKTENYNGTFNLVIAEGTSFKDLDLSVASKAIRGEEDQGGGPIWRCTDADNYYIARFNPLESNFRVYYVKDGRRKQLDSANVRTQPGQWYEIRVTMRGDHIVCYLDGEKLLEVKDDTFADGGMVGLWTKADAVTSFDDLTVRALR